MTLSEALPILGPLLQKPHIEWFIIVCLALFGLPGKETEYEPEIDDSGRVVLDPQGRQIRRAVQRWRSRGLVNAAWVWAAGHARLADRVGALEHRFEAFVQKLDLLCTAIERSGVARPVVAAGVTDPRSRRPLPSQP